MSKKRNFNNETIEVMEQTNASVVEQTVFTENKNEPTMSDLEREFKAFEDQPTNITPEGEETNYDAPNTKAEFKPTPAQLFKIKMFAGLLFFLLSGLHTFLLNKIKRANVLTDDMLLTDTEKEVLQPYLELPEIIEMIDKLPPWIFALTHVEYIYFSKHAEAVKKQKEKKQ